MTPKEKAAELVEKHRATIHDVSNSVCPDCGIKMKKKYDKTTDNFGNVREFFCKKCRCGFVSFDYSLPQPMCVE